MTWSNPNPVPECISCDNEGCEDCHEWGCCRWCTDSKHCPCHTQRLTRCES